MEKLFNMEQIGRNISQLRRKIGMTQMELADKLLISFQAVSSWERGVTMPDIAKLPMLAEILGVSADEILSSTKGAEILEAVRQGNQPEPVFAEEILEAAPVMRPEQVDLLVHSLEGPSFTKEQAEVLAPMMAFDGDFDRPMDEIAEKAYETDEHPYLSVAAPLLEEEKGSVLRNLAFRAVQDNKIAMLHTVANLLDAETIKELAFLAFDNGNIAIFGSIHGRLDRDTINKLGVRAFEESNMPFFGCLSKHLDEEVLKELGIKAFENGNIALFGTLSRFLDEATLKDLAFKAFERRDMAFIGYLKKYMGDSDLKEVATNAFDRDDIAIFNMFSSRLDADTLKTLALRAYDEGKVSFFQTLSKYLV